MKNQESQNVLGTDFQAAPLAQDREEVHRRHQANRSAWNEGAAHYTARLAEDIAFLQDGGSNLHLIEQANLGDLSTWCKTAVHLQCASGRDTLSLWNEGAREVIGIDISDVHIANACQMSEALGAPARWFCCDVLDTPHQLNGAADLVYTGRGALCWLHDLDGWAAVIYRLLKPGGLFHILDDHPMTWLFNPEAETYELLGATHYFDYSEISQGWSSSYIGNLGRPTDQLARKYERLWPLSAVFTALQQAGLAVEKFGEHPDEYWNAFPNLKPELKGQIPMTFSMLARRVD